MLGVFTLGLRHGLDVDHVAAITDISGAELSRRRAFLLCEAYALGHAGMVAGLGLAIAWSGIQVPDAGRLVGATLVGLGLWVLWSVAHDRPPTSRAQLATRGLERLRRRLRPRMDIEHDHPHEHHHGHDDGVLGHGHGHEAGPGPETARAPVPVRLRHRHRHRHADLAGPYTTAGSLTVGLVHGIGAETPTQVLALASGPASLVPFLGGLLLANTMVALGAAALLTRARLRLLNAFVGVFSIVVGVPYLLGRELTPW